MFKGLANLRVLSLAFNPILTIEKDSFSMMNNLEKVYLDENFKNFPKEEWTVSFQKIKFLYC